MCYLENLESRRLMSLASVLPATPIPPSGKATGVSDIATAGVVLYKIDNDPSREALWLNERRRRFEISGNIYLGPVPAFDRHGSASVYKLKPNAFARRI